MCNKYGQTFLQAHYYKKRYHKMRLAAIVIQKVRLDNAFFATYVVCRVMMCIFFASL